MLRPYFRDLIVLARNSKTRILPGRENRLSSPLSPPLFHDRPRDLKRSHESKSSSFVELPSSAHLHEISLSSVSNCCICLCDRDSERALSPNNRRATEIAKEKKKQGKPRPPDRSCYGELNDDEPPGGGIRAPNQFTSH